MKTEVKTYKGYRITISGSALGYKLVATCGGRPRVRAEGASKALLVVFAKGFIDYQGRCRTTGTKRRT